MVSAAPGAPGVYRTTWRPAIFDRYLLRSLALPAAAVLGVTLVAFLLEQTLRLIDELASRGAHLGFLFGLIGNLIPYQLGLALPAAFFVSMFIVIARLDEESELDAILAGGVSFERIVAPLVFIGVVLGGVSLLLVGYLQPYSHYGYRAVRNAALEAGWTAQLDPEVFINAGPDFTITADEADATGRRLKGVFIRRRTDDGETVVTAADGVLGLRPDGKTTELHLGGGVVLADIARGGTRLLRFADFTDHEHLGGSEVLRPRGGDEQELTLPELVDEMGRPDALIPHRVLQAEFYARLARSLAIPFLPLLALPLAMAAKRGRRAPGMILGAVILVAFHHGVTLAKSLAASGALDPLMAIGGLFGAIAAFGLWMFLSSRRRPGETPFSGMFAAIERMFDRRPRARPTTVSNRATMSFATYLGRIMAIRTAAAAVALIGLLQLIDLLERTSDLLARGGLIEIGRYMFLRLPGLFQQAAPFAVLAGAIFTFSQLARNSELVVMRITGLSLFEIFRRTLPVALTVCLMQLVVADQITPRAEQALATWWTATTPAAAKKTPTPRWFRIDGDVVMVRSSAPNGATLQGVSIYQRDPSKALIRRMVAATATAEPGGWRLHDARVTDIGRSRADSLTVGEMDWRTSLRAADAARLFSDSYQITSNTAFRSLVGAGPVDKSPNESKTRLFRTVAEGVAPIIMLLLALPTALGHARSNKTAPVIFGVGCGLLYLVSDGILTAMGQTGALPPALAAWGAPLVFAAGAISILLYAEG
ncbi:MAG TPA: LptF/LptG family permease [Caulobacteraceae bacterium]|nr:LptF/LptG family permease [Caulobacteraceae bacterium]